MDVNYYTSQSPFTDPGVYSYLYHDLPADPTTLLVVVQNCLIHQQTGSFYKVDLSPQQRSEYFLLTVQKRLARMSELSPVPLIEPRQPEDRQVGICRDFALLFVSLLRYVGTPARMRVGFAPYLDPQGIFRFDHWITEYWDGALAQWVLADPQIDDVQREALSIRVNTRALRRGTDFILAGDAWQACRAGSDRSSLFRFNGHWKGMPCIRGNLLHDFDALNKIELSPWDYFDSLSTKPESQLNADDKSLLDRIASLTLEPDDCCDELQNLFEELPRTRDIFSRLFAMGRDHLRNQVEQPPIVNRSRGRFPSGS